jgi:hypothetical protein
MLKQPEPTLHKTTRTEITSLFGEAKLLLDETPKAISPFGGLASFISFLGQIGFARQVQQHLPFAEALVAQLTSYVDGASGGDATIIESAGFSTRANPTPVGEIPAPTDLQVTPSEFAGSADVKWKSKRGAVSFTVERAEDAPTLVYGVIGNCTQKQTSLNSMVSGKKYWFRMAAIGAAGQSAWSDPVPLFAP